MISVKRKFYLFCMVILGILLSTIAHVLIETWYIALLIGDFGTYGLGFSWESWFIIHHIATVVLLVLGILFGYWLGVRWWQIVYVEKRHWSAGWRMRRMS